MNESFFNNAIFLINCIVLSIEMTPAIIEFIPKHFRLGIWMLLLLFLLLKMFFNFDKLFTNKIFTKNIVYLVISLFAVVIFSTFDYILGRSTTKLGNYYLFYFILSFYIIGIYSIKFYNKKQRKIIILLSIICGCIHILYSTIYKYFFLDKLFAYNILEFNVFNTIDSSNNLYVILVAFIMLICFSFTKEKKYILIFILLFIYTVFIASRMITVLLLTTMFLLNCISVIKKRNMLLYGMIIVLIFSTALFLSRLFVIAADLISVPRLTERFYEIARFLGNDDFVLTFSQTDSGAGRIYLWLLSFSTFLEHPILGNGYHIAQTSDDIYKYGIGNHSDLLDFMASFGIIIFSFILTIFKNYFNIVATYLKNSMLQKYYFYLIVLILFYALINGVMFPYTGIILCQLVPFILLNFDDN